MSLTADPWKLHMGWQQEPHLGFAWVWFLRNRAFGPNKIPAVHGGVEAWSIHTQSNHTTIQSKPTNTVTSWYQNPVESLTLSPANPTICGQPRAVLPLEHAPQNRPEVLPFGLSPTSGSPRVKYFKISSAFLPTKSPVASHMQSE